MAWEYRIVQISLSDGEPALNALGSMGWELVSVNEQVGFYYCFLKRPIKQDRG